jgi:hypothetical protein
MALEIMLNDGKKFCHDIRHDLESVFYVLIWVCCHMDGPEMERSNPFLLPVREWCNMNFKLRKLGLIKLAHLANFEDSILKHFTPYWTDFKPFMRKLRSAFWPGSFEIPNSITSEEMLKILREAANEVKDKEVQSSLDSPVLQNYALLNSKRNRQGQDAAVVSKRPKTASVVASAGGSRMQEIWKESISLPISDTVLSLPDSAELSS